MFSLILLRYIFDFFGISNVWAGSMGMVTLESRCQHPGPGVPEPGDPGTYGLGDGTGRSPNTRGLGTRGPTPEISPKTQDPFVVIGGLTYFNIFLICCGSVLDVFWMCS